MYVERSGTSEMAVYASAMAMSLVKRAITLARSSEEKEVSVQTVWIALIRLFGVLGTSSRKLGTEVVNDVATDSRASATPIIAAGAVSLARWRLLRDPGVLVEAARSRFEARGASEAGVD